MANYKEIVTKAVLGKGKKIFSNKKTLAMEIVPSTVLGCWVINHNFKGYKNHDSINIEGNYDINIWYAYDNDTQTNVVKENVSYLETVNVRKKEDSDLANEEIIVRALKNPTCTKAEIVNGNIEYTIEKELGIEVIGDTKVKIAIDENEEPWEEIIDTSEINQQIDNDIEENYIDNEE
jgi:spore coat protein E